jgi:hypothetical protein
MQKHVRHAVLATGIVAAVVAPLANRVLSAQQEIKCYFKDCVVFEDGSRLCTVKEVPCEHET